MPSSDPSAVPRRMGATIVDGQAGIGHQGLDLLDHGLAFSAPGQGQLLVEFLGLGVNVGTLGEQEGT